MCGIVGLRLKNPDLHPVLGELVVPMLDVLASRGPGLHRRGRSTAATPRRAS